MIEIHSKRPLLIVVCGPTASGKTSVGIELAQAFNSVILSADSRQFYKEIPIGTAQPDHFQQSLIKHFFISDRPIETPLSAGEFEKEAIELLNNLFQEHKQVLLVGGSGLFVNAICDGFHDLPKDNHLRNKLNLIYKTQGIESLANKLLELDPEKYRETDIKNPQRLIRAIEIAETSNSTFKSLTKINKTTRPFDILKIGLNLDREKLYDRINKRVDQMVEEGLEKESRNVYSKRDLASLKTVGYSEFFEYFDGKISYEECIDKIKQNSRRYAKRQLTWFNKDKSIKWFEPNDVRMIKEYIFATISQ